MQLSLLLRARGIADLLLPTARLCAVSSSCNFSSRAWFTTKSLSSGLDRGAALFSSAYWITTWSFATCFQHPWKTQNWADFSDSICRAVFHPALFSHAPVQKFGFNWHKKAGPKCVIYLWKSLLETKAAQNIHIILVVPDQTIFKGYYISYFLQQLNLIQDLFFQVYIILRSLQMCRILPSLDIFNLDFLSSKFCSKKDVTPFLFKDKIPCEDVFWMEIIATLQAPSLSVSIF